MSRTPDPTREPSGRGDASQARDREPGPSPPEELSAIFTGELAPYRGALAVTDRAGAGVSGSELLRPAVFDGIIARFASEHRGGDRRAVVSLWFQWYAGTLVTPAVAASLLGNRRLPLGLDELEVLLEEGTGRPVGFRLPHWGHPVPGFDPFERLRGLVHRHLEPLVASVSENAGLAPRLLWCSVGSCLDWVLRVLEERSDGRAPASAGKRLLRERRWPDGKPNHLFRSVRRVTVDGEAVSRRRICCLRHLLPGFEGCGSICPLPPG